MSNNLQIPAMGWLPDYPDVRDYTFEQNQLKPELQALGQHDSIKVMLAKVGVLGSTISLPSKVNLTKWCSPIEDQEDIGSCTAQAGVGLVEYFQRRAFDKHIDASRLFLYKVTRNLLHWTGDTGAFLRTTMAAMTLFGLPPEEYHPYDPDKYEQEPSAFCYAYAQSYQAISYYRLDPPGISRKDLLELIKRFLAYGLPSMFGFTVYSSISQSNRTGEIPFPVSGEKVLGGHAVDAVGYDDEIRIKNASPNGQETKGALLIRNSWGQGWGSGGYGWLPYEYVLQGLAIDWWSLLKNEWIDSDQFGLEQTTRANMESSSTMREYTSVSN